MFRLVQPFGIGSRAGGGAAASFDPSTVSGYARDWNFADVTKLYTDIGHTTPVTADADTIGSIVDGVGGTVYLAAPADNTTRPLYKTNIQNGLSVGRFDGSNDALFNATAVTADASQTIFLILKKRSAASGVSQDPFSMALNAQLFTDTDAGTGYLFFSETTGATGIDIGGTVTNWNILALKFTSVSDLKVYVNGGAPVSADPHADYATATHLSLGAYIDNTTNPGDWDIGRVLVYSAALSTTNLDYLFSGLGTLWDIAVTPTS
jgi:hypothetical protein